MNDTPTWSVKPWRIAGGLLCFSWVWLWFEVLERGTLRGSSEWIVWPWVATLLIATMGGVLLTGNGLGLISSELLATSGNGRAPTFATFAAVYLGFLFGSVALTFVAAGLFHVHWARPLFVLCGLEFIFATLERPWWIFATIRRLGWFAFIKNDRTMKWLLAVIGIFLVAFGLLVPLSELPPP